jgi:hypothetical protein
MKIKLAKKAAQDIQLSESKELELRPRPRLIPQRATLGTVVKYTAPVVIGRTPNPSYHKDTTFLGESDDFSVYDSVHTWWIGMPGYQRLHLYLAAVILPWMGYHAWYLTDIVAQYLFCVQLLNVLVIVGRMLYGLLPVMKHRRVYTKPLAVLLSAVFQQEYVATRNVCRVPKNFGEDHAEGVRVYVPQHKLMDDQTKKRVQQAVAAKLGISELSAEWRTVGARPCGIFKPLPKPPSRVDWDDVKDVALKMLSDSTIFIGLGRGRKPMAFDLATESPHLAISGGSNSGKSVLLRTLLAQAAFGGARTIIFDVKRVSHKWAKNLPGIEYYRDINDIHDALCDIAQNELRQRTVRADNEEDPGRRIFVVLEEMNTLMLQLRRYWRNIDGSGPSPAVEAISDLLCMGREVSMNVVVAAQNLTARSIGGPEARENFSTRALARYSPQMWNMLCGDVRPMPKKMARVGVWQIVYAGEAHETQVAFMTPEQARQLVLSANDPAMGRVDIAISDINEKGMSGASAVIDAEVLDTVLTTLEESSSELGVTYGNLCNYRARDNSFPKPQGKRGKADIYDLDELRTWKKHRDASKEVNDK